VKPKFHYAKLSWGSLEREPWESFGLSRNQTIATKYATNPFVLLHWKQAQKHDKQDYTQPLVSDQSCTS